MKTSIANIVNIMYKKDKRKMGLVLCTDKNNIMNIMEKRPGCFELVFVFGCVQVRVSCGSGKNLVGSFQVRVIIRVWSMSGTCQVYSVSG